MTGTLDPQLGGRILLFVVAVTVVLAIVVGYALSLSLIEPLRDIADAVRRVSDGDLSQPIPVNGSDVLAQLAESHNRLVADAERRNRQLGMILAAVERASPEDGTEALADRATRDAEEIFELIAGAITFTDPKAVPEVERVPGDPLTVRADMRVGDQPIGVLIGRLPATRTWERADQALFELYGSEIAAAVRNAQLFAQVEAQNAQLRQLDEAKDDFLRGVSHNLQTPLTRIKANAEGLERTVDDPRLGSISDQADRLSRMVAQLLLVGRLGSGQLRPQADVIAVGARIRRAWDALAAEGRAFDLDDASGGWLAVADGDQLDQVLWALLDNAVKYGEGGVDVAIGADDEGRRGVGHDHVRRAGSHRGGSRVALRTIRPRCDRSRDRRRERSRPVRLPGADARHGRRSRPRPRRARTWRSVPADPSRRAATGRRGVRAWLSGILWRVRAPLVHRIHHGGDRSGETVGDAVRTRGYVRRRPTPRSRR